MSRQKPSPNEIRAPLAARIVELEPALILEAMKMEHVLPLPPATRVREWRVAPGDMVEEGALLAVLEPSTAQDVAREAQQADDAAAVRADLQRVIDRHAFTLDANREEAVTKRHPQR